GNCSKGFMTVNQQTSLRWKSATLVRAVPKVLSHYQGVFPWRPPRETIGRKWSRRLWHAAREPGRKEHRFALRARSAPQRPDDQPAPRLARAQRANSKRTTP